MYYREWLRARRNLVIFVLIIACLIALQLISNISQYGGPVHITFSPDLGSNDSVPMSALFAIAGILATIFAGILGTSLSVENSGHLEVAWTKPASRNRYALAVVAADAVSILIAWVLALGGLYAIVALAGYGHRIVPSVDMLPNLLRFAILPFAWYAVVQALTASLRERGGVVAGLSWVIGLALLGMAVPDFGPLWSHVINFVNFFNPIAYAAYTYPINAPPYPLSNWELNALGLAALSVLGVLASLTQWRRLEV